MPHLCFGLDFGTTNTSLAWSTGDGRVELARFAHSSGETEAFRSLLYLEKGASTGGPAAVHSWAGPSGIERYLEADSHGRLIQSLKSFLSSRTLQATDIFGRQYTIEELIARIVRQIREEGEQRAGAPIDKAAIGRPVRFVGSESTGDDNHAVSRLTKALHLAGFSEIRFEMEPVAAAYFYESQLDHDELILIGDFGGGTSDFSLLRVGPGVRRRGRAASDLLGNAGVGLAGDAFDAKIVRQLVSPSLGAGSSFRSGDKSLPMPNWVYRKLERWHHLSFLRSSDVANMLRSLHAESEAPEKIHALRHIISENLGFQLHKSVQEVKCALSTQDHATFHFEDGALVIQQEVTRAGFESWVEEELAAIETCVDSLFTSSAASPKDVDMVFLTGGSSFVPAVRRIFESRFGAHRIRTGNEFTSVALGLALIAAEPNRNA
ncbi:MAG: Hsp70 family protein [Acidobacteria bacterium]|nr:Hsp70 family protein [Acidobacteriota bacterium]